MTTLTNAEIHTLLDAIEYTLTETLKMYGKNPSHAYLENESWTLFCRFCEKNDIIAID